MKKRSFKSWMFDVDAEMLRLYGVCSADLPDWIYAEAFDAGVTVRTAVDRAYAAACRGGLEG